jgi:hypothetical protein
MSKKDKQIPDEEKRIPDAGSRMPDHASRITHHESRIPEEPGKIYVLVWYQSIVHDSKIIWPGDEVDESIVMRMPPYLKQHFWEKGIEIPQHVHKKLSKNLQEKFKIKK